MGQQNTKEQIEAILREAYDQYVEHQRADHDMAEAGRELFYAVTRILDPPVCSVPRDEVLEAEFAQYGQQADDYDYSQEPPEPEQGDEYGYREYR